VQNAKRLTDRTNIAAADPVLIHRRERQIDTTTVRRSTFRQFAGSLNPYRFRRRVNGHR
jgi:hypothetical protein